MELTQLDISSNNFSGLFTGPHVVGIWPQLAVLDASSNAFVGPLPQSVYELPMLEFLNLANNRCGGCSYCVCVGGRGEPIFLHVLVLMLSSVGADEICRAAGTSDARKQDQICYCRC
jgi:hypothetical protein